MWNPLWDTQSKKAIAVKTMEKAMKKVLAVVLGLMLYASGLQAQVLADFESPAAGTQGFADENWGTFISSVSQAADPSGASSGVLKVTLDAKDYRPAGDPKDPIATSTIKTLKGKFLVYYVWLPASIPNGININPFMQSGDGWAWQNASYLTDNLAKEKWVPVYIDLEAFAAGGADLGKIQKMGIEFQGWNMAAGTEWTGDVYVDNISLLGAEPKFLAQFEDPAAGTQGFADENWGTFITGLAQVADPSGKSAGVLEVSIDAKDYRPAGDPKDPIATSSVKSLAGNFLVYHVWLPADVPAGVNINPFFQTGDGWKWQNLAFLSENLEKEKWVSLVVDLNALTADGADFSKVQKMGIEFQGWNLAAGTDWKGKIYVDDIAVLGTETGAKWVVAGFESAANPTQGFGLVTWGAAFTKLTREVVAGNGVLQAHIDFSVGTSEAKGVIQKDNIAMYNADVARRASRLSLEVYIPENMPLGGQIGMAYTGAATNFGWIEDVFQIDTSSVLEKKVIPGKWNKIWFDFDNHVGTGEITDTTKAATLYVQVFYGNAVWEPNKTFAGDFQFDNLTLIGIPEPKGSVVSPVIVTSVVPYAIPSDASYEWVKILWEDNKVGTETYNIYQSESPVTDVNAAGVKKIAGGVPHGMQGYAIRPWTLDGGVKTYYYAVTAFDGAEEKPLSPGSASEGITVNTSAAYKVKFVKDFAFQLDGLNDEFLPYESYQIRPDVAGNGRGPSWTPESMDMNFRATFVIDEKYLYISAEVDDDNLRHDPAAQAWEGDALEFYMGFYDRTPLKEEHAKNYSGDNGDWRIGFNSDGLSTLDGGAPRSIKGVKSTVFEKFSGDGYIIEAQLELDSLAAGGNFELTNNMLMPLRIDGNDMDPVKGETSRGLIVQAGGVYRDPAETVGTDEDWKRPDGWGSLAVIDYTGTDVADGKPFDYSLSRNYPNPFNPSTTIKYSVANQGPVLVKIYDMLGREVSTLVNKVQPAGSYVVEFNANGLASGVYILKINAGTFTKSMKMMLVK